MGALIVVSILTGIQIWYVRRQNRVSWLEILSSALVGLVVGLVLDYALGYQLGLWSYLRHPYWELSYWTVLPAMWTEFGVGVYILWSSVRLPGIVVPAVLACPYETYGIIRSSWTYNAPFWLIASGWVIMISFLVWSTRITTEILRSEHVERADD